MIRTKLAMTAALALATAGGTAWAQSGAYPSKPIRILVGFAPGGGTDIMARTLGPKLTDSMKQQFVVDNRPGANGNIAAKLAIDSPPDGYTIMFMSVALIMSKPLYKNLGFDVEKDLAPITVATNVPNVVAIHPTLPVKNVRELVALAKKRPGEITYGTSGIGSPEHYAGEMLNMMAGIKMAMVPYKGGGPLALDLVAGHVISSFSTMPAIIPFVRQGRVKAIAVTMDKRAAVLPDVPTVAESGVPGYSISTWYSVVAPAKTPPEIITRLNAELAKALALPDVKERMASLGAEVVGGTTEQTATFFRNEAEKYAKVAAATGMKAE